MQKLLLCLILILQGFSSLSQENEIYINKIWTFQGNEELYVPLHIKDSVDQENPLEYLKGRLDSVIVNNTYQQRKRLPRELADSFFDLEIINNISVYNSSHDLLTTASLRRVEYFEDMIEGMFIAVYDASGPVSLQLEETNLYCMAGNFKQRLVNTKTEEITKKQWDEKIKKKIYFDEDNLLTIRHYEVKQNSTDKLTLLSLQDPESFETGSFLLEQNGSEPKILKQVLKDYVIWNILPIPVSIQNKPVLLVEIIIPETDYTGYTLAVFNGSEYEFLDNMKLTF